MDDMVRPAGGDAAFLAGAGEMAGRFRDADWAATPLGPVAAWPAALRTLVGVMLGANQPMFLAWGPERTLLYNDAYSEVLGRKHPAALGRPLLEVWHEIRDDIAPLVARVFRGEPVQMDDIALSLERRGHPETAHFAFSYTPVRDEEGAVAGLFCACQETTGQVMAERRLRHSEARLRGVLDGMGEAFGLMDREFRLVMQNAEALRLDGRPAEEILGRTHWEAYPGSEDSELGRLYKRAMAEEVPAALEHLYAWENGQARWLDMRAFPVPEGLAVFWRDISARKAAEAELRDSEARVRLTLDAVPQIVWIADADGRTEFFNAQWFDYTGATSPPVTAGQVAADFVHPDDAGPTIAAFDDARRTGSTFLVEHRIRSKDGAYRWFLVRGEPHRDPRTGKVARWFGASVDIHDRREAEAALRASEARLRFLGRLDEALRDSGSAEGAMAAATELLARHLGASRCAYADVDDDSNGFVIRRDWSAPGLESSVGTYGLDLFGARAAAAMRAGTTLVVRDVAVELAPEDGRGMFQSIGIEGIVCCPLVKDGRLAAMMAVHQAEPRDWAAEEIEIVEAAAERCWAHVQRVGAEARLRESEARLRLVQAAGGIGSFDYDLLADDAICSPEYYALFGLPEGHPINQATWAAVIHPEDQGRALEALERAIAERAPFDFEYRIVRADDGRVRWLSGRAAVIFDAAGRPWRYIGGNIDVTDRKRVEESLRELNETLERQVAQRTAERDRTWVNSRDLLVVMGIDGVFRSVNPAWTAVLGWPAAELVGRSYLEFIHPDDHPSSQGALATASARALPIYENRYRHKDGSYRVISWVAAPEGELIYASGRDITAERERQAELEAAQGQLRQSQKMEAMGQLTGGVAHDFNNLLTPIIASLDMLLRRGLGSERERRLMDGALQSAERAKVLVQRLLAFARRQPLQPGPVDVRRLVEGMAELLGSTLGPRVELRVELPPDLPPAVADANQLEMAVLNLAVNARDAMPEGGTLSIRASRESVRGAHRGGLRPGHYVRLSVEDSGAGMDPATLARAVEPFFSTKGVGRGTGLGLSMVHGLASQLGGGLVIDSRPGAGTTVELWLPLSAVAAEDGDEAGARPGAARARGTALLVDDEDLVRMSTADMLADLGYEVVEARSAEEALRAVEDGLSPDLVVTDHLMPGMSGVDLARALRERRPDLAVLIVSGYAEVDGVAPGLPRLAKPFRAAELEASLAGLGGAAEERA